MAAITEINDDNFDAEVSGSDAPVLLDFWAEWCHPCHMIYPEVEAIAEAESSRLKVGKLNTDDNQDLAVRYGISGIPQVLIFKGGDQPKERVVGLQSEAALVKLINNVLGA